MSASGDIDRSFSCRIQSVKALIDILSCLLVQKEKCDQICGIEASNEALLFVVSGRGKSTQIRVNLPSSAFDAYFCSSTSVQLNVNLTMLLDCLQLVGSVETTTATITYSDSDAIFRVHLEDEGFLTQCDLTTPHFDSFSEGIEYGLFSAFVSSEEDCQVILKSEVLKESIQELFDVYGTTVVTIEFSQHPAFIKFTAQGVSDICEIEFPKNADIFVSFQCQKSVKWTYGIQALQLGMKSLGIARETFIRVNAEGVVCIQHQIDAGSGPKRASSAFSSASSRHPSRSHSTHKDYGGGVARGKSIETYVDFLMIPEADLEAEGLQGEDGRGNGYYGTMDD